MKIKNMRIKNMGRISGKVELKKQLKQMGVKFEGNYVRKAELFRVLSDNTDNTDNTDTIDYEKKALDDYQALLGKTVLLKQVMGMEGSSSEQVILNPPKKFKICKTDRGDVLNYNEEWIDPQYNVEPLGDYPEIQGMQYFWCCGKSYNTETGEVYFESWWENRREKKFRGKF